MIKHFTIDCEMEEGWINAFGSFLKRLEYNGNIGHSEVVGFYSDGDGDFRPKFDIHIEDTFDTKSYPIYSDSGRRILEVFKAEEEDED